MENQEDDASDPEVAFQPLFIDEEGTERERDLTEETEQYTRAPSLPARPRRTCAELETHLTPCHPHLREMDELLRSCEGLVGASFSSAFSSGYADARLSGSAQSQTRLLRETNARMDVDETAGASLQTAGRDGTRRQYTAGRQDMGSVLGGYGDPAGASPEPQMPLTSAGSQLSGTMEEYQTHLLGMLAMLESCMDEAGMDFDPQEFEMFPDQRYGQIPSPAPGPGRATTAPMEGGETAGSPTRSYPLQTLVGPGDVVAQRGERVAYPKAGVETGAYVDIMVDLGGFGAPSRPSGAATSAESRTGGSADCEGTRARGHMSRVYVVGDADAHSEGGPDPETDPETGVERGVGTEGSGGYREELKALGARLEECIEEVGRLTRRREELAGEVLELRGESKGEGEEEEEEGGNQGAAAELLRMLAREAEERRQERLREAHSLRRERGEEEGRLARARLERQGLQEETRRLKRRLFAVARDCAHSQVALATQQREVAHFNQQQEELQSHVARLTEEASQLRSAHQTQLSSMQAQLQSQAQAASQTARPQDELTQCRRHSCGDVQQYLQGGLKALEERYEPMLLGLLKRREGAAEGLVKTREQAQELRARLGPLRGECQRLGLQRACLEERLKLTDTQRREDVEQYKEMVAMLEETSRELRTELLIQKRKTREMEELKDSLAKQILHYRDIIHDHKKCEVTAATMMNET